MRQQLQQRIVRHAAGEAIWFLDNLMVVKATAAETGAWGIIEATYPPDHMPPPHIHHDEDEAFYILEGTITFEHDGEKIEGAPGTFALLPRGERHTFRAGPDGASALVFTGPSGNFVEFVREFGVPAETRSAPPHGGFDVDGLLRMAAKYNIEILPDALSAA